MQAKKILIAGGGIGGLTAALCLARAGLRVAVFERAPEFGDLGAGIQLSPNGSRVLHHLGLAHGLGERACLPEGTEFRAWKTGRLISAAALGETARSAYGFPYYHIHRGDLLALLVAAARRCASIELHTAAPLEDFVQDDGRVRATIGGARHEGQALIGADGVHSRVRVALFGEGAPTFTGNIAWRILVPAERLPRGFPRPVGTVWWGPGGHFVCYGVRGGSLINCVCVVEKDGWTVESWTERGTYDELKSDFVGWHGDVQALLDNSDRDSLYKWALYDRAPMPHWGDGAVTLLGDACHPTLPFMAQGAAMAIEDAAVLADCLSVGADVASGLRRYEGLRRERTARVQISSRRNARVFHLRGYKAWLRNLVAKRAAGPVMHSLYSYNALTAAGPPHPRADGGCQQGI